MMDTDDFQRNDRGPGGDAASEARFQELEAQLAAAREEARQNHERWVRERADSENLKKRAEQKPHRYTFVSPRSGDMSREEVCDALARTLAEMYRNEIDATGQPMSPDPFQAIQNAIEHYRVDDILISTLKGEQSVWLQEGLIDRVKEITEKPVEHVEASAARARRAPAKATVGSAG